MNFDMTPYGAFIWPAYAISFGALAVATIWTVLAWRAAKRRLAGLEQKR
jgi:heme exporter protein CcmD